MNYTAKLHAVCQVLIILNLLSRLQKKKDLQEAIRLERNTYIAGIYKFPQTLSRFLQTLELRPSELPVLLNFARGKISLLRPRFSSQSNRAPQSIGNRF